MSSTYTPSDQRGKFAPNGVLALLFTLAIFAILPLMHYLGAMVNPGPNLATPDSSEQPPPPPPEEPPPPPEEEKEQEKPEVEEPPPPLSLLQLELALNPGDGGGGGDFGFGDFDTGIDALEGMQIFSLADVDRRPTVLVQSTPQYPYSMQQSKTKGRVVVECVLDDKGKAHRPRVVSSTHREFEQAAMDSVLRSTYSPASKDGKAVAVRIRVPVDFSP